MKKQDKKPKRNLHTIVVDALGNYSYPIFITKVFKKDVADKVCKDFCEEYYPSEPTTADEFNSDYLEEAPYDTLQEAADDMQEQTDIHYSRKEIKGSRDGYWRSKSWKNYVMV